ncbi:MAG: hypothetical protein Q7U64_00005 [Desulfocapsaceae bacterium]|nr:hypothetical protein [Desulfocapsaceae bacterium]
MTEYYRNNQYYNGVNFADYRFSAGENRTAEPTPNSESKIETNCYECGIHIILIVPYKIKRQRDVGNEDIINKIESNLCSKCRIKIYDDNNIEINCDCGKKYSKKINWIKNNKYMFCECGAKIDTTTECIEMKKRDNIRTIDSQRCWYNLLG